MRAAFHSTLHNSQTLHHGGFNLFRFLHLRLPSLLLPLSISGSFHPLLRVTWLNRFISRFGLVYLQSAWSTKVQKF